MSFFPIFSKKSLFSCLYFVKKRRPFSKKHSALMSIFCLKTSILSYTLCSHVLFFQFLATYCHAPYWSKKKLIPSKLILCAKIVDKFFFVFRFSQRTYYFRAHILSQKLPLSSKHCALIPTFYIKLPFSQKPVLSFQLFQHFHKTLLS